MKKLPVAPLLLFIAAVLSCIIWSCTDDSFLPVDNNLEYFPLEVGNYIVYEVDSTRYDDFNMVVHQRTLQVREIIESIFIDAGGNESYRVERQYRNDENSNWGEAGFNIWAASFDGNNAERVEENQRYIKIAFPARLGKRWAGNIHIHVDADGPLGYLLDWEYEVTGLDQPLNMNGMDFDSTLTIVEQSVGTAIDTIGSKAIYAKGIGLVFRELWVLDSQCNSCEPADTECIIACQNLPWVDKAEKGFIVKETILEYGTL